MNYRDADNGRVPVPKYFRVKEAVLARIVDGTWPPGAMLPTEPEFCDEFGVSRITVRKAIGDLVHEGKVETVQGKGTFVATPKLGFHAQTADFFDALASGSANDQAAGIGSHMCQVMTPLACFVVDALTHVDRSRGVGKQVFGDRPSAPANFVAAAPGNPYGKPCRYGASYGNSDSGVFRTCSSAACASRQTTIANPPTCSVTRSWRPVSTRVTYLRTARPVPKTADLA